MKPLSLALASAFLLASQESAPAPVVLTYDWPEEGAVRVIEEILKTGNKAETTYVLRWSPADEGGGIVLEHTDFEFVSIAGIDAENPLLQEALREAKALSSAIPRFHIDVEGYVTELEGFEELLERLAGTVWKDMDEEALATVRQVFRDPEMQALLQNKMVERWGHWVASWIGTEVERGTDEVWELDAEVTGGAFPAWHVTYGELEEHRGLACVEISVVADADEEQLLRQTLALMGLVASAGAEKLPDDLPLSRVARRDTIRGIYAVDGLRPIEVHTSSRMRVWERGSDTPLEQLEEHTWRFAWDDLEEQRP